MSLFRKHYKTPASNELYTLFDDMASQPHLLVAGATGSGKSVVVNGIIYNLLHNGPEESGLILIDPKRVELIKYKSVPHCIKYASEPDEWIKALDLALNVTEQRFQEMHKRHEKTYSGGDVYVIVDELAFLMTAKKREALPRIQKLGMIARAAKVHMIACTQTVKADVLPTTITCNFDARVALRTSTAQQSRMVIGVNGCEQFPSPSIAHKAYCYYRNGADLSLWQVPKYSDSEIETVIKWWTSSQCVA
jgi:S-DNA-T family DNA segregation ATPase FtsK/SpoIIIE